MMLVVVANRHMVFDKVPGADYVDQFTSGARPWPRSLDIGGLMGDSKTFVIEYTERSKDYKRYVLRPGALLRMEA